MIENGVASEYSFREATKEERQAIADYIDSISVDTGCNLWDLQEQVKIYDAYYNKGYAKGKADAIEEIKHQMNSFYINKIFEYGADIVEARADVFGELEEWLKENKNE